MVTVVLLILLCLCGCHGSGVCYDICPPLIHEVDPGWIVRCLSTIMTLSLSLLKEIHIGSREVFPGADL